MEMEELAKKLTYGNYRGETVTLSVDLYLHSLEELSSIEARLSEAGNEVTRGEGMSMVRSIYRTVDRIGKSVEEGMSCRAGCAACCRMLVAVTRGEGEILRERMDREPEGERQTRWRTRLLDRTEVLLSIAAPSGSTRPMSTLDDLLSSCGDYADKGLSCPFLGEDRLCEIYEDRPLMCRMCWTLTPPVDCDPGQGPPVKFRNGVFFKAFELVLRVGNAGFGDVRHRPIPLWLTLE